MVSQFGLTLDKTRSDAMNPFIDNHQDKCILEEPASMQHNGPIAYLAMDLKNQQYDFKNSFYLFFKNHLVFSL